jgi:hypothetical protein
MSKFSDTSDTSMAAPVECGAWRNDTGTASGSACKRGFAGCGLAY